MAKKLRFDTLWDEVKGTPQNPVAAGMLYNELMEALRTDSLKDIGKNFANEKDMNLKIYVLMNYVHNNIDAVRGAIGKLDQSSFDGVGFEEKDLSKNLLVESKKSLMESDRNRLTSAERDVYEKVPCTDASFKNVMSECVNALKGCKSRLRGSSDEFEDILNLCKTLASAKDFYSLNKNNPYIAKSICTTVLLDKMDKYIDAREKSSVALGTGSYKGKRIHTMIALREKMRVYDANLSHYTNILNNKRLATEDSKMLEDLFKKTTFNSKFYNLIQGNDEENKLSEDTAKVLDEGLKNSHISLKEVQRYNKKITIYQKAVSNVLSNTFTNAGSLKKIIKAYDFNQKNIYMLGPSKAAAAGKITFSNITGVRNIDTILINNTYNKIDPFIIKASRGTFDIINTPSKTTHTKAADTSDPSVSIN